MPWVDALNHISFWFNSTTKDSWWLNNGLKNNSSKFLCNTDLQLEQMVCKLWKHTDWPYATWIPNLKCVLSSDPKKLRNYQNIERVYTNDHQENQGQSIWQPDNVWKLHCPIQGYSRSFMCKTRAMKLESRWWKFRWRLYFSNSDAMLACDRQTDRHHKVIQGHVAAIVSDKQSARWNHASKS